MCLKVISSFPRSTTSSFVKDYPFSMVLVTAKITSRFFDLMHLFFSLCCVFTEFFCFHGHNSHQHSATFFCIIFISSCHSDTFFTVNFIHSDLPLNCLNRQTVYIVSIDRFTSLYIVFNLPFDQDLVQRL